MSSAAEELNNAIGKLDFAARIAPIDDARKRAVAKLAAHWQKYFWRRTFRNLPQATYLDLLNGYVRWYTRAYQLLPEASRASLTPPGAIDVSFGSAVEDEVRRIAEVAKDASVVARDAVEAGRQTAAKLAEVGERAARGLAQLSDSVIGRVERDVFVLLGLAVLGLYFWGRR